MFTFIKDPGGHNTGYIKDPGGTGGKILGNDPNPGGGYRKEPGGHAQLNGPGGGMGKIGMFGPGTGI